MEKFQESRDKAKKSIQIADHMLSVSYPLIQDPKLLLAIMDNIFLSYSHGMDAILYYDRVFKKVPAFHDIFESKFNLFKARSAKRYQIGNDHLILMQEIKDILLEHKKSPVEFTRRDKFVICSDKYVMRTISLEEMGGYINKAKLFIQAVDTITTENERIFR